MAQTSYSHYPGNPTGILETNTESLSYHTEFLDSHSSQPGLGKIPSENVRQIKAERLLEFVW